MDVKQVIEEGKAVVGIEFGSTRIKAVMVDSHNTPIAQGGYDWENQLVDGIWTYDLAEVRHGLQACYANLAKEVKEKYGLPIRHLRAMGVSAMMHGYLVFGAHQNQLVPFRTWRNTITEEAAQKLTAHFNFPIPQRWSVAHLYQAILNGEPHVKEIAHMTTLAGYVHFLLTGENILGIGDASGMFPIDSETKDYQAKMLTQFDDLVKDHHFGWRIKEILPEVRVAGQPAGVLTEDGAKLLDPTGTLQAGVPFCPPEGDAGTGMVATNSVAPRTGNVSAGTSVFAMVVLERPLSKAYPDLIDLVTTPDGLAVAMSHANNCTGEYDHWMHLFQEVVETVTGAKVKKPLLYDALLETSLDGDKECGGLLPYNYLSGEAMTGISEGRPMFIRETKNSFTLANFMRAQLFTACGALRIGMDILFDDEQVKLDAINGHGGFFKTAEVGQRMMAAALHTPVSVLTTAGEGGAWGIALLAAYLADGKRTSLPDWLNKNVFASAKASTLAPSKADVDGFNLFLARYKAGLPVLKSAIAHVK